TSPSPRVHFQVRITPELGDLDEGRAMAKTQPVLGPAVGPLLPPPDDHLRELLAGRATPERRPQVDASGGVEAEVPEAVGREAAPVAVGAERRGGRRDDAEDRPVGQAVAIGGRRRRPAAPPPPPPPPPPRHTGAAPRRGSRVARRPCPSTSAWRRPRPCTR